MEPEVQEESLIVNITADPKVFSPGETVTVTVAVENPTDSVVDFGIGSSSCRFGVVIRIGEEEGGIQSSRLCTPDMSVWSLGPGEKGEESWVWNGNAVVGGTAQSLSPGQYELIGVAGKFQGSPFTIEVTD